MRRIIGFVVALAGVLAAGVLLWREPPVTRPAAALAVPGADAGGTADDGADVPAAPAAPISDEMREARRLARTDKDDDGRVSRPEFLANRRKSFDKADRNHDGRLDFEEYAVATATRFAKADRNADGQLTAAEFATTAVRRKPRAACACPPPADERDD
jgi:hypothetical protein